MTQEDKVLLAKDLFSRALSGIKVNYRGDVYTLGYNMYLEGSSMAFESYPMKYFLDNVDEVKPYLRPMSSMTEEEEKEFQEIKLSYHFDEDSYILFDWLNAHHFDYRGLIEKGLALEATEGMYYDIKL